MRHKSPVVHELEIWSPPGVQPRAEMGHEIAVRCQNELVLSSEIILGLSFVPDHTDSTNLQTAIREGELSHDEFLAYCESQSLPPDANSIESACNFLAYFYGTPLAWVHLPIEVAEKHIQPLFAWVKKQGLCLVEPSDLYCFISGENTCAF